MAKNPILRWLPPIFLVIALIVSASSQESVTKPKPRLKDTAELSRIKVNLELENASLRDALRDLFSKVNVSYIHVLENASRGKITMTLRNVPFEGALVSVLRSIQNQSLGYVGDGGVLRIAAALPTGGQGDFANKRVWMDVEDVDIRQLIGMFLKPMGANFVMDQNVRGSVSLKQDGVPYRTAFERVLKTCKPPVNMRSEDGILRFEPGSSN